MSKRDHSPQQCRPSTTPRSLAWLVLRRSEKLDEIEQQHVVQLRERHAQLNEAVTLTQEFARLARERQGGERPDDHQKLP